MSVRSSLIPICWYVANVPTGLAIAHLSYFIGEIKACLDRSSPSRGQRHHYDCRSLKVEPYLPESCSLWVPVNPLRLAFEPWARQAEPSCPLFLAWLPDTLSIDEHRSALR